MEFINTIHPDKFRATNAHWNNLFLNDPWSVGYVSTLIETQNFSSKEAWEQFYYESGAMRDGHISKCSDADKQILNNFALKNTNPNIINELSWEIKNLNFQYGRTKSQMAEKGRVLFDYVSSKNINISLEECIECVRFRTICETWNGIIVREKNTVETLKQKFPSLTFEKTTGEFDHKFAVDYELKFAEKLACGIQIKPKSYLGNAPYLKKAQQANRYKNSEYQKLFGKPVFDIISQLNGVIVNSEVFQMIDSQIITTNTLR
jgi:ferredoxin-like protein FixX